MITLIGKNSQLGMSLLDKINVHVDQISSNDLDMRDTSRIVNKLQNFNNKILINCSAFNDVEDAEINKDAFLINHLAVKEIAKYCSETNVFFIHISTDFVFDGVKGSYSEADKINPLNKYGKSKAAGEKVIQEYCNRYVIIRTSWLYSHFPTKNNFLFKIKTMMKEGRKDLYGANDIFGSPTSANSLAEAILAVLPHINDQTKFNTIYHFADVGRVSRFVYLQEINSLINKKFKFCSVVKEVDNDFFKLAAPRPADSSINNSLFCNTFSYQASEWRASLQKTVELL